MNTEVRTRNVPADSIPISTASEPRTSRCTHAYADGRRCRTLRAPKSLLCSEHAATAAAPSHSPLQPPAPNFEPPETDVSADLLGPIEDFRTAAAVNHALGKLLILLASNRISPRRGAVLAYTCQLLLQSVAAVDKELWLTRDADDITKAVRGVLNATSPLRIGDNSASQ